MYSSDLYRRLLAETGIDIGWREVGSLRLASSPERMQELERLAGSGQTFGLPLEIISTEDALARWPLFDPTGILGAAWLPTDGQLDPSNLTLAFADGAKRSGVDIRTNTRVTGVRVERGHVRGVETDEDGFLAADVVVNAGGIYAWQLGRLGGVEIPVVPFEHMYVLTEPIVGVPSDLPTMRDPDRLIYFRGEAGGGLVMGGYERNPKPWRVDDGPPADFNHQLLPDDWDRFGPIAEAAAALVPAMASAGIASSINGPEAFSPDGEFLLGETEVGGLFVAAGFGAHGIAGAGGIGKVMAEWIVDGEPAWDLWKMDIRRFGPQYRSRRYAEVRAYEIYATNYDIHYPGEERLAGRPLKIGADLCAPRGPRRRLRREVGMGASELVQRQRESGLRGSPSDRVGRRALVHGHRRGASRVPRTRGALRRVLVCQARGTRSGRDRLPGACVCGPRRSPTPGPSPTHNC